MKVTRVESESLKNATRVRLESFQLWVEAIVKSRPLTDVPLEAVENMRLTPNHLLRINSSVAHPFVNTNKSDCYSRQRFRIIQFAAEQFWKRWIS